MFKLPTTPHNKSQRTLSRPRGQPTSQHSGNSTVKAKLLRLGRRRITQTINSEDSFEAPSVQEIIWKAMQSRIIISMSEECFFI